MSEQYVLVNLRNSADGFVNNPYRGMWAKENIWRAKPDHPTPMTKEEADGELQRMIEDGRDVDHLCIMTVDEAIEFENIKNL